MTNTTTIAIPPFPSQDLAKLVLGYLAEEQLMTAYDEFLQASPYLDALRNEYDRIFMTSLKNILAEYRAVKIYVETCKPFILRKKLVQCANLLEIVKFLASNVDINKIHLQEGSVDKAGCTRHSISKSNICDVCISLKLPNCMCRNTQSTSHIAATSLEESVEATSLADLPGNISYKKKITKDVESEKNVLHTITSSDQIKDGRSVKSAKCSNNLNSTSFGSYTKDNVMSSITDKKCASNSTLLANDTHHHQPESRQLKGLNSTPNPAIHNRSDHVCIQMDCNETANCSKFVNTEVLQNTAAGADSSSINKAIVPDSSTSENIVLQTSTPETNNSMNSTNINKSVKRHPPLLIKIGTEHKHLSSQPNTLHSLPRLAPKDLNAKSTDTKIDDQYSPKITILSDVKVDNDLKMPPLLKGTATNSLLQMQTIYINGTPAYKNTQEVEKTFTKDEIMAMPTIILVPASDKTKNIVPTVTQNNTIDNSSVSCSTREPLEPLVIDVSSNDDDTTCQIVNNSVKNPEIQLNDNNLIKTVDVVSVSHASLPKDNTLAGVKTSTPQVLPPVRKSSSTPRRTSHVRVLDFTTPRRILHEVLNEHEVNKCPPDDPSLAQDSISPVINNNNSEDVPKVNNIGNVDKSSGTNSGTTKDSKTTIKLYNWDSDLRALAYAGNGNIAKMESTQKSKLKKSKKKVSPGNKSGSSGHNKSEDSKSNKSNDKKKVSPKTKSVKSKKKSVEPDKIIDETQTQTQVQTVPVVKPTINIISRKKWSEPIESEKSLNKSSNVDENIDTPELERISLQNEIVGKLNISDILETPYKQALYDIQMETPKFLDSAILGDPLSDIKIMNIPTPRFLNTPKLPQNTPSSYSSRPTDYSSGGSYYKPDDQDYVLGNEIMEDAQSVSTAPSKINKETKTIDVRDDNVEKEFEVKSRPVRQCTKNVSYNYNTPSTSRIKDVDEKVEKSSTCSDVSISKTEKKLEKPKASKSNKDNILKHREPKKRLKKSKLPGNKEAPKTFMKIKPRRTTPVKEVLGKSRKRTSDINQIVYIKSQSKKIGAGKEKSVCFSSLVDAPVHTKSRRKSSTPRKLHCTKRFNSDSSSINSPERKKQSLHCSPIQIKNLNAFCTQDSDCEQQPLRWSDDGSQEGKVKTPDGLSCLANESDDISRIKEYINKTGPSVRGSSTEAEGTLQVDLIKRGFDVETARMIERDLLETPPHNLTKQKILQSPPSPICHVNHNIHQDESKPRKSDKSTESDCSTSNNLQIIDHDDDDDDIDFSVQECNEDTNNYFVYNYDETKFVPSNQVKLKETFSMEICIENDVAIRLRAMPFNTIFDQDPKNEDLGNDSNRTEKPTSSASNALYTPRKAQCYEIFDSTLTSLDTPLKCHSPKAPEFETVTEIVLEVEKLETDIKTKPESKKRRRVQSGASDESTSSTKKVKPDTSYLLNSAGIQNIDIESVLSKLHGP